MKKTNVSLPRFQMTENGGQKTEDRGRRTSICHRSSVFCHPSSDFRAGLTIVEMMVAVAAVCIVVLAAGLILVYGQKSWDQGLRQAKLQRDVSYAMLKMKRSISAGTLAQVDEDGLGVKIFNGSGWIKYRFYDSQHDLRFQEDGDTEQTLLGGSVDNASFGLDPATGKMVLVDIELEKDGSRARLLSKTMMRNYGT